MVKDASRTDEDYYFISQTSNYGVTGNPTTLSWDALYKGPLNEYPGTGFKWSYARVYSDSECSYKFDVKNLSLPENSDAAARVEALRAGTYYGDMEVKLVYGMDSQFSSTSGYDFDGTIIAALSDGILNSAAVLAEYYTLHARPGTWTASAERVSSETEPAPVHSITIQPVTANGENEDLTDRDKQVCGPYTYSDGNVSRASYVTDLSRGGFKVSIVNNADADLGVDDIKWDDADTYAKLYKYDGTGTPLTWKLSPADVQYISLSKEQSYGLESGRYKLVISLKNIGGQTVTKEYDEIYIHNMPLPEFGAAGVRTEYSLSASAYTRAYTDMPGYHKIYNEDGDYGNVSRLYMSANSKLYFTAKNAQTGALFSGASSFAIRIWKGDTESGEWRALDGTTGTGNNCYLALRKADLGTLLNDTKHR